MARRLAVCRACGRYTMQGACPACGQKSVNPHPMRFSPEDQYGRYRRQLKRPAVKGAT